VGKISGQEFESIQVFWAEAGLPSFLVPGLFGHGPTQILVKLGYPILGPRSYRSLAAVPATNRCCLHQIKAGETGREKVWKRKGREMGEKKEQIVQVSLGSPD